MSMVGPDLVFAIALERRLFAILQGDGQEQGLYYLIAHGVPTWDRYNHLAGEIQAYERVVEEMRAIIKQMGGSDEPSAVRRAGMN